MIIFKAALLKEMSVVWQCIISYRPWPDVVMITLVPCVISTNLLLRTLWIYH